MYESRTMSDSENRAADREIYSQNEQRDAIKQLSDAAQKILDSKNPSNEEIKTANRYLDRVENLRSQSDTGLSDIARSGGFETATNSHNGRSGDGHFESFGNFLQSVVRSCRQGATIDDRLQQQQAEYRAQNRAITGLGESIPSDGGFLIGKTFEDQLLQKVYDSNPWMRLFDRREVGPNSNGLKIPGIDETSRANSSRWGGISSTWTNEGADLTGSTPKFNQIEMSLEKLSTLVYLTSELLQDSTAVEDHVKRISSDEISFKIGDAILNADGVGKMAGILQSNALVTVDKEGSQSATTFLYENLVKQWSRLWGASKKNAIFLANSDVIPELYTMNFAIGTSGAGVYTPEGGASARPFSTLFSRPLHFTEFNPSLGTAGDVLLIDPSQYIIIEKGGIQSATSIHVSFTSDQVVIRMIMRINGQSLWANTLTPFKGTDTVSPFVCVATRS